MSKRKSEKRTDKKNEKRKLASAFAAVPKTLLIDDVRAALEDIELDVPHFSLQQAISGPFALTALIVDGGDVISDPIDSSGRTISVPITTPKPFDIRWSATFGQDQPKCVGYYVEGPEPLKLEEKRNISADSEWISKSHPVK